MKVPKCEECVNNTAVYKLKKEGNFFSNPELVTMTPSQPNGIGFSEDETILYVSDTDKKNIGIYKNDLSSSLTELMPQPKPTDFVSAFSLNIPLFNSDGFFVDHYIWTSQ